MSNPDWMWNEMRQVGTDYADIAEVAAYDTRMASFRDVNRENQQNLSLLALAPGSKVLETGCGTGRFVRAGFEIVSKTAAPASFIRYLCRKT